jgi:hypothetical protein
LPETAETEQHYLTHAQLLDFASETRMLGHASASMTLDRYGHLYSDDLHAAAAASGEAIIATQGTDSDRQSLQQSGEL